MFDVAVLDSADEVPDPGAGAEFFGEFANQGRLHPFGRFDVAAGQERR